MEPISFDTFLLLVLLILVGIVLFLSLVIAIYVVRLSRRVDELEAKRRDVAEKVKPPAIRKKEPAAHAAPPIPPVTARKERKRAFDASRDAPDIPTGMQNLCSIYGLDSLTVSSPDGLVIASSGHPGAVTEAAQFSYAYQTGTPIDEAGVMVFPVDFNASPLVGILRSNAEVQASSIASLQKDLVKLLEKWI